MKRILIMTDSNRVYFSKKSYRGVGEGSAGKGVVQFTDVRFNLAPGRTDCWEKHTLLKDHRFFFTKK